MTDKNIQKAFSYLIRSIFHSLNTNFLDKFLTYPTSNNKLYLNDLNIPAKTLLTNNLNIIATTPFCTVIQQKPMCRNIFINQKQGPYAQIPNLKNTYYLAFPYIIYIITYSGEQKGSLYVYFSNHPVKSLNQPLNIPYLLNTEDLGTSCVGFIENYESYTHMNQIIEQFWNSEFVYPLSKSFYYYYDEFNFDTWEQITKENPTKALQWITNQNWLYIHPKLLTSAILHTHELLESFEPVTLNDLLIYTQKKEAAKYNIQLNGELQPVLNIFLEHIRDIMQIETENEC